MIIKERQPLSCCWEEVWMQSVPYSVSSEQMEACFHGLSSSPLVCTYTVESVFHSWGYSNIWVYPCQCFEAFQGQETVKKQTFHAKTVWDPDASSRIWHMQPPSSQAQVFLGCFCLLAPCQACLSLIIKQALFSARCVFYLGHEGPVNRSGGVRRQVNRGGVFQRAWRGVFLTRHCFGWMDNLWGLLAEERQEERKHLTAHLQLVAGPWKFPSSFITSSQT